MIVIVIFWLLVFLELNLGILLIFGVIIIGMFYWGNINFGLLILFIFFIFLIVFYNFYFFVWVVWIILMVLIVWCSLFWGWLWVFIVVGINIVFGNIV